MATYRRMLIETLSRLGASVELICDDPESTKVRPHRGLVAARLGARQLRTRSSEGGRIHDRPDLFAEAQRHFSLYGRFLPLACADPPDVVHWAYPLPMRMIGARNVYTVHDAIPIRHPELTGICSRRHRRLLERLDGAADLIVTVSDYSRAALDGLLPRHRGRVAQTYQAVAVDGIGDATPPADLPPDGYLLVCGSVEPRKNIGRILSAYKRSGTPLPLVVAGPDGWRAGRFADGLRAEGVVRLTWSERDGIIALIRQARALLLPSLAEGFGLPLLEAMSVGTPVLTSDRGALAEIAGGAALAVDPEDTAALAEGIAAVAGDAALRQWLRRAGLIRAQHFGVNAYGDRLSSTYHHLLRPDQAGKTP